VLEMDPGTSWPRRRPRTRSTSSLARSTTAHGTIRPALSSTHRPGHGTCPRRRAARSSSSIRRA